jgi:hypothetical protein
VRSHRSLLVYRRNRRSRTSARQGALHLLRSLQTAITGIQHLICERIGSRWPPSPALAPSTRLAARHAHPEPGHLQGQSPANAVGTSWLASGSAPSWPVGTSTLLTNHHPHHRPGRGAGLSWRGLSRQTVVRHEALIAGNVNPGSLAGLAPREDAGSSTPPWSPLGPFHPVLPF